MASAEEEILDQSTAARTIAELNAEIATLKRLEALALALRRSGEDRKWCELGRLLGEIFTPGGNGDHLAETPPPYRTGPIEPPTPSPHQKLVLFTEHRDTLTYLESRITTLLGRKEAVVLIHGGMGREERTKAQEAFRHDPEVQVLLATDAAGEGINLQRAHLMVNYDLPWNPNRIEQRFGRIHRIGQKEVCHLWHLVAEETREGDVYRTLLEKLGQARQALGGQVFDVLGKVQFEGKPLRELLIEAIRYGERPEVQARLTQVVANAFDKAQLQELLEERALAHDAMDATRVYRIREEMERAEARRLQPHYIESFFLEAFHQVGGAAKQREPPRHQITHVPAPVRNRDRLIGAGEPVLPRYERVAFEKGLVAPPGQPLAAFLCPGHPLLDATIDLTLERHRDLLRRGAVLVDERDAGTAPRMLFYLEHAIQDASLTRAGERRLISKRMLYVEVRKEEAEDRKEDVEKRKELSPHFSLLSSHLHVEVRKEETEKRREADAGALQGVDGLAKGDGSGAGNLSPGTTPAQGRDLRNAVPDDTGGGLGFGEHCGGLGQGIASGEGPVHGSGAGFTGGDRHAFDVVRGYGLVPPNGDSAVAGASRRSEPHVDGNAPEGERSGEVGMRNEEREKRDLNLSPRFSLLFSHLHYAPYLDYRPLADVEVKVDDILARPECRWVDRGLEQKAQGYAVAAVVPEHLAEVRARKLDLIAKTEAAVQDRLTKEITYWDHRAEQLKLPEHAGKPNARLNSDEARKRADGLQARLQKRMEQLKLEKQIAPLPPVVMGGVLVVPAGLLRLVKGPGAAGEVAVTGADNDAAAAKARSIIMRVERELGFVPTDRETEKLGYDVESRIPGTGKLRFIEVKGRVTGAATITVTKNEILHSLNKPDDFILGIVEFDGETHRVHYVRWPFQREPDFGVTSVNYSFAELLTRAEAPK